LSAILAAWLLAWSARHEAAAFRWAVAGAGLLTLAFVSWLLLVQPVNREIAQAASATPELLPALWQALRGRWEYGHALGFALDLLGFCALAIAATTGSAAASTAPARTLYPTVSP
jgi:hypothetical protein